MADLIASANPAGSRDFPLLRHFGLWRVWLIACAVLLLANAPQIMAFQAYDPDDYTRLLQVRDWLAGQDWFDTRQYRWNPPFGGDIHWVRLGDLPLAAMLYPLQLILERTTAEIAAMTIVPLLQLLVAMAVMERLTAALDLPRATRTIALIMLPTFPVLLGTFAPLRVDYHGWLAVCALAITWLTVAGGWTRLLCAGIVASVALVLSLETMPFVIGAGGWLAARYWWQGRREHEPYFLGLALGALVLVPVFRPPSDLLTPYCDVLSAPHLLAFVATAALILASRRVPTGASRTVRLLVLLPVPVLAAALIVLPLGICAVRPLIHVDALARSLFFDRFIEALPITAQQLSAQVMLLSTALLAGLGGWSIVRGTADPHRRDRWLTAWVLAMLAAAVSLVLLRASVAAQLLAVPICAVLVATWLPRAQAVPQLVPRLAATMACLGLLTPVLPTALATPFDQPLPFDRAAQPYVGSIYRCDYRQLGQLPPSRLFTPIAKSSELMAKSAHSTIAGTYHRSDREIHDVIQAFAGPLDGAEAIVRSYRSDYLVYCASDIEPAFLAAQRANSLGRMLTTGQLPNWLEPVPAFATGPLKVYRVRQAGRNSSASPLMQ